MYGRANACIRPHVGMLEAPTDWKIIDWIAQTIKNVYQIKVFFWTTRKK